VERRWFKALAKVGRGYVGRDADLNERRESRRELRDVEVERDVGFSGNFKQLDDSILRLMALVYLDAT
jgi:hypothetical protein